MYCINCGVKLADSQKKCPLCGTVVFHPDLPQPDGEPLYPAGRYPGTKVNRHGVLAIITAIFLLPLLVTLRVDMQITGAVTWSGYVMGAIILGGAQLGDGCLVAAGSVVTGKTAAPAGWLLMGNPAKLVRNLTPEELMANLKNATEYVVLGKKTFGEK